MTEVNWKDLDAQLLARAWEDDAFRATLRSDPQAAVSQAGLAIPEGMTIEVVERGDAPEDTAEVHYLVLPEKPKADTSEAFELSEEELTQVAGGGKGITSSTYGNKRSCGC
jgi:hypothetical protein